MKALVRNTAALDQNFIAGFGHFYDNPNDRKRTNRAIIVSNISLNTKRKTICKAFEKFGYIYNVELKKDENDMFTGVATVEFNSFPRKFDIHYPMVIRNQPVIMEYGRVISKEHRPTNCFAKSFSLGIMLKSNEFVEEWTTDMKVNLTVNYKRKMVDIVFQHLDTTYQMETKFGNINKDVVVENIGRTTYLTIPLIEPAKYYEVELNSRWRISRIPMCHDYYEEETPASNNGRPTMIFTDDKYVRLCAWTVCRLKFEPEQKYQHWLRKLLAGMADYNLVPRDDHLDRQRQIMVIPAAVLPAPKNHLERARLLKFDVLYHLECNISSNILVERNLDDAFYVLLASLDPPIACGVLTFIAQQQKRVWYPTAAIKNILKKYRSSIAHKMKTPDHCLMLRKVIITPTTTYVEPLSIETANRVVRHFKTSSDRFIRVQFADEGKMRMAPSFGDKSNAKLLARIFDTLINGIQIGDRRYEYLGFSSSQLREHGCWYYAPLVDTNDTSDLSKVDAELIRSWMGDFSDIKIVAKHAARIGQCFSSTTPTMRLVKNQVAHIPDIIINDYTFSDGVGNISKDLAFDVARRLSLRAIPSAFQFRLGGAKGVLMVSKKLKGRIIQLRPSQIKFSSDHYMLEVVRTSSNISAYLNRQSITLLSTLGVKDNVFMSKLRMTIKDLNRMLAHPNDAIKVLQNSSDNFGIRILMSDIISAGYLERKDPFIKNLINVFRLRMLKNLKEKAKLPIKKGAFLFGVIDEAGVLKENEVFCQVTSGQNQQHRNVIVGECVLYRNPCFHPGDIRVVSAVDYPSLRHLRNVIVFPRVGCRDIPSMCSGGDLDGDEYTIMWDQTFMPTIINHPAMNYTAPEPVRRSDVTTEDIQRFFVEYINNDNLGQIANAHLAWADRSEEGAMDGICQKLAELHSAAVDFPKTGIASVMDKSLRARQFPDFMDKEDKDMYRSMKVLGKMYRQIDKADYDGYEEELVKEVVYDTRLRIAGMERYIASARQSLEKYNSDINARINQFGIKTEAELISGFVISWLNGRNRKSDYQAQKQASGAAAAIRRDWKQKFMREFRDAIRIERKLIEEQNSGKKNQRKKKGRGKNSKTQPSGIGRDIRQQMEAKAAAWYYVTYHPAERGRDLDIDANHFSFPWVMNDILVRIGKRSIHHKSAEEDLEPVDEDLIRHYQVNDLSDEDTQDNSSDVSDYDFDYDYHFDYSDDDDTTIDDNDTLGGNGDTDTLGENGDTDSDNDDDDTSAIEIDLAIGHLSKAIGNMNLTDGKNFIPPQSGALGDSIVNKVI